MLPVPDLEENEIRVGLMLRHIKEDWIVIWAQRFAGRTYQTTAGIYPVLVVTRVSMHEILSLIAEYTKAIDSSHSNVRILYKKYDQPETFKFSTISKLPIPLVDVYLSHSDI